MHSITDIITVDSEPIFKGSNHECLIPGASLKLDVELSVFCQQISDYFQNTLTGPTESIVERAKI